VAIDLNAVCSRLDELGRRRPDEKSRAEVEDALSSKWQGVQVVAARALATWGDERSLSLVRGLLERLSQKKAAWAAAGALANALAPKLKPEDLDWVFKLFLSMARRANRYALIPLFEAFDPRISIPALQARLHALTGNEAVDLGMVLNRIQWRLFEGGLTARSRGDAR
jgi:hypothetical protein